MNNKVLHDESSQSMVCFAAMQADSPAVLILDPFQQSSSSGYMWTSAHFFNKPSNQNKTVLFSSNIAADQLLNECMSFGVAFKALTPLYYLETQRFPFPIPLGVH